MRVRLTTGRAGARFSQAEGEVVDLPPAEAERLVAAGQAERLAETARPDKPETAMRAPGRTAMRPRGRARKGAGGGSTA